MNTLIFIGMGIVALDLFFTFRGRPLIGPGPWAKLAFNIKDTD